MFDFKGKTALVTGANRGIGEAFVHTFVAAGASKIYAAVRNLDNASPLANKYPGIVQPLLLDVSDQNSILSAVQKVTSLDILVNNAGIANPSTSTSDNLLEIARSEMETNYFGPLQLTLALMPLLKASEKAAIVNICSIAAISNFPSIASYSASKAAIHSMTQGYRAELNQQNIRAVGVYPGPIDTRMAEGMDMDKPHPSRVANKTLEALRAGVNDVFPDDFSEQMYATFRNNPAELEKVFAGML